MAVRCFIKSIAQVSCQKPLSEEWFDSPCHYEEQYARAQEPDTKGVIPPAEARRMGKILKRAACTAISAINQSGIGQPDAIITGTGMGCIENSEKFLIDLCKYGEECLKPTLFMQSTHNTISSMIAITLKCHGYNNTYSHKGISFESALFDAWLQIKSGMISNALVGGHDEVTPFMSRLMRRTHPEYSFISETSVSAVISNHEGNEDICEIEDVEIFHTPEIKGLSARLSEDRDNILLLGINGNPLNDKPYENLLSSLAYRPETLRYKHIFGENYSSPATAFLVGATILKRQKIPRFLRCDADGTVPVDPERITILNHSDSTDWSLIRLKTHNRQI